nr:WYL domain-containing protein [Chloroflexia bacterium]
VMAAAPRENASRLVRHIRIAQDLGVLGNPESGLIQQALLDSVAIELTYRDAQERKTVRVVEAAGLFGTGREWYLAAWCRLRQAPRIFRLDRIARVRLTHEPVVPRPLDAMLREVPFAMAEPSLM